MYGSSYGSFFNYVYIFLNQATQEVVSQVPISTYEEFKAAVSSAKQAFRSWKNTSIATRQSVMFKLQELIRRNIVSIHLGSISLMI